MVGPSPTAAPLYRLRVREPGSDERLVFPDVTPFVIGREDDCDLVLTDSQVSRHHLQLEIQPDGRVVVRDLNSANGTFVDSGRVVDGAWLALPGMISVGRSTIVVDHVRPGAAPTVIAAANAGGLAIADAAAVAVGDRGDSIVDAGPAESGDGAEERPPIVEPEVPAMVEPAPPAAVEPEAAEPEAAAAQTAAADEWAPADTFDEQVPAGSAEEPEPSAAVDLPEPQVSAEPPHPAEQGKLSAAAPLESRAEPPPVVAEQPPAADERSITSDPPIEDAPIESAPTHERAPALAIAAAPPPIESPPTNTPPSAAAGGVVAPLAPASPEVSADAVTGAMPVPVGVAPSGGGQSPDAASRVRLTTRGMLIAGAVVAALAIAVVGRETLFSASSSTSTPTPLAVAAGGSPSPAALSSVSPTRTPSPSPTPTFEPTPTATATPTPTPEPWRSYRSSANHYSVLVPPDWTFTPGDSTYADDFEAPGIGYPELVINRDVAAKGYVASVSKTVPKLINSVKSKYKAKLLWNRAIRLTGGYSGRILMFSGTDSDGLPIAIQKIDVAKGRIAYFLTLYTLGAPGAEDVALFKQIYTTWRSG